MEFRKSWKRGLLGAAMSVLAAGAAHASDHKDSPSVIADPAVDIGDIFAWTSPDAKRLNLVMAIVGHSFSERHSYTFHIDSGRAFGKTTATVEVTCRFEGKVADCRAGDAEAVKGDASDPAGIASRSGRMRVFAGLRDDPFFNNVRGTREAYNLVFEPLLAGKITTDVAGCPAFGGELSAKMLDTWKHTTGGPPQNLLKGWTPASIVISLDLSVVTKGGKMLAVWGEVASAKERIDRMGRPLTGNALLATTGPDAASDALKEAYNRTTPSDGGRFVGEIEKGLALYDGFDGQCGNAWLSEPLAGPSRYLPLAILLADDRLWVNGTSGRCTGLFAVELAALSDDRKRAGDCGGRTPNDDAVDTYRSLLVAGDLTGVTDGVDRDEREHSTTAFPFLAAPEGEYK